MAQAQRQDEVRGTILAGSSYVVWGIVPLYWRLLDGISPVEITLHRILWCALTGLIATAVRNRLPRLVSVIASPPILLALAASSILIALNWTIYIYCVSSHQLVDASLGYYLTPLISIVLGVVFLGERISKTRIGAVVLASIAVAIKALTLGRIPWVAPALALSFGFYGYVRKLTPVDALDGLTIETCLLLPITLAFLLPWALLGIGAFPSTSVWRDGLLIGTGPLTAVPLVMFAAGARRLRMVTLGLLQFLSPTITLLVAMLVLHEPFSRANAIAFGCVWAALLLVAVENQLPRLARRWA